MRNGQNKMAGGLKKNKCTYDVHQDLMKILYTVLYSIIR